MHFTSLAAISLASVATAAPHLVVRSMDAPKVTDNPAGAWAEARFDGSGESQISGYVRAISQGPNQPVHFDVSLNNLPEDGGDHAYHIHVNKVAADGNCTSTGAHLDPENRGEDPPCDSSQKSSCQVGDLAGKYGKAKGQNYQNSYEDWFVSLKQGDAAFFGDRSITIHKADKTRIACTDFKMYGGGWNGNYNGGQGGDVYQYSSGNGQGGGNYNGYNGENDDATAQASSSAISSAWSGFKNRFPFF